MTTPSLPAVLDEKCQQAIGFICDMALRGGGLQCHEAVSVVMAMMSKAKMDADTAAKPQAEQSVASVAPPA